ncbi:MAG: phosphatidylserine decarboxylase family protein [Flavobacteriales bacterium]
MRFHKEGYVIMTIAVIITAVIISTIWFLMGNSLPWLNVTISLIPVVLLYLIIQFFRVPNRSIAGDSSDVICPADGKVVVIERVFEPEFIKKECLQISIFMSPLNVHANYASISGEVIYTKYHEGSYLVAWHPKSSTENERSTMVLETASKKQVLVRQIAGALARRICFYAKENEMYEKGDEFGFIKFGSRVDVFLPLDAQVKVQLGQKVKNREDILASI